MIKRVTFEHNFKRLTDESRAMLAEFKPERVVKVASIRIKRLLVNHFNRFNAENPNQFGARRTNMVADFARATNIQEQGQDASVSVTHVAILQKIYGGPIVPRLKRYLTLPAIAEAYGKPSRDFPARAGLKFEMVDMDTLADREGGVPEYMPDSFQRRERAPALVEREFTELSKDFFKKSGQKKQIWEKAKRRGGRVIYWLVRKVNQRPTPGIVPDQEAINAELYAAVDQLFKQRFGMEASATFKERGTGAAPWRVKPELGGSQ